MLRSRVVDAGDADIKEHYGGAANTIAPNKLQGTYVRAKGLWRKGTVKKIDYKKRRLTVATGGYWKAMSQYSYSKTWVATVEEVCVCARALSLCLR